MKRLLPIFLSLIFLLNWENTSAQELVSSEFKGNSPLFAFSLVLGPQAKYSVDNYKITYTTVDVKGLPDTASGLVSVPVGIAAELFSPLALVQHGTVPSRDDVPSNLAGGFELGAFFSSLGYITIQPDYIGLGDSDGFHPYVHADTEASAGADMIFAAKEFLMQNGFNFNDQLFITGYSQGGHAAMAAHQLIETSYSDELTVTASAPLSGPYSISTATQEGLLSDSTYLFPGYAAWTVMSYNEAYGLYDSLSQYMKQPYADMAMRFFREEIPLGDLHDMMIDSLTSQFGGSVVKFMFQDSLISGIQADENHPLNVALRDNDTYLWAPTAPTRLFYCMADDQVTYRNSILADSVMNALGAVDLESRDVMPTASHTECVLPAGLATIDFFQQYANFLATSTRDLPQLEGISAFPNPARNSIQINGAPADAQLSIFDLQGKLMHTQAVREASNTINLKGLGEGLHVFRMVAQEGVWTQKIMIQK